MGKWLTLYHPRRRITTTVLDTDTVKLDVRKRGGWKVGALPPEDLPDRIIDLETLAEAGDLLTVDAPKAAPKKPAAKKAKKE